MFKSKDIRQKKQRQLFAKKPDQRQRRDPAGGRSPIWGQRTLQIDSIEFMIEAKTKLEKLEADGIDVLGATERTIFMLNA
jgi:hypothetical protein